MSDHKSSNTSSKKVAMATSSRANSRRPVLSKKKAASTDVAASPLKVSATAADLPVKVEEMTERFKNKSKILESIRRKHKKLDRDPAHPKKAAKRKRKADDRDHDDQGTSKSPKKRRAKQERAYDHLMNNGGMATNGHLTSATLTSSSSVSQTPLAEDLKVDVDLELTDEEKTLFESLIYTELDPNGGGLIMYSTQEELDEKLTLPNMTNSSKTELLNKFAVYFLKRVYSEHRVDRNSLMRQQLDEANETSSTKENDAPGASMASLMEGQEMVANYALGIVRNSASSFPQILDYFAEKHPQMIVKTSLLLNSKEINTLKMSEYQKNVNAAYLNGTYRYGPLLQTSIVGIRNEEIGDYFPDFIENYLERNPFLYHVMPWGPMSLLENMNPMNSDDGPILWARPGEQMIPTSSLKDQQPNAGNISANASTTGSERRKK